MCIRKTVWFLVSNGLPLKGSLKGDYKGSIRGLRVSIVPVWFLVGNGGMDYGDYHWGLYRDYYRDPCVWCLVGSPYIIPQNSPQYPFTHSRLSTRDGDRSHVQLAAGGSAPDMHSSASAAV